MDHPSRSTSSIIIFLILLTHALVGFVFYRLCIKRVFRLNQRLSKLLEYPVPFFLHMLLSGPVLCHSIPKFGFFISKAFLIFCMVPIYSVMTAYVLHLIWSIIKLILPAINLVKLQIREIGVDGIIMNITSITNLSLLLRVFFLSRVYYQLMMSKTIAEFQDDLLDMNFDELLSFFKLLLWELLYEMCGTILSVMGLASVISIMSSGILNLIYYLIGAQDEDANMQPAVSGFLFVLLALQTGMTSTTDEIRLKLLLQNCILLTVANQHFIQGVTSEMIIKVSTEDISLKKHIRPMLPYLLFFSFPFLVVARLWDYPFRMSWLLAITAFTLELIIKSLTTALIYCVNMLHTHRNFFTENIDDILFYIKAVSGFIDFICGIFLFINGAYIFFFESGGFIRFTMMIIHFYCNIYQTATRGIKTLKLRRSAWKRVNRFKPASQEQLDDNDDICPICYQEMVEAVVIKCGHVFHKYCLQKWLTIQEKCPLCHVLLDEETDNNESQQTGHHQAEGNVLDNHLNNFPQNQQDNNLQLNVPPHQR